MCSIRCAEFVAGYVAVYISRRNLLDGLSYLVTEFNVCATDLFVSFRNVGGQPTVAFIKCPNLHKQRKFEPK